ncbi:hypothetical protein BB559_001913 [Furculomyces boomerangus]|uniref:Endoplasmic reticulum vesicle transporter C-terminal domain-containing protein n=2 Tax=Harpellales TaxID=61421 RepID=A0A2T9YZI8_9FUNG|nr:hypothetical protein BB559_001913 [Furculomyces boomerangus]PWA02277.1 hypothetical protein BB558_001589 [Smittium angustum]
MAHKKGFLSNFQSFDVYAKTKDDFRIKTISGAVVSLISMLIIFLLVLNEYSIYSTVKMVPELVVDKERMEKMKINIDITFPNAPCILLGLDIMDSTGEMQINSFQNVNKTRLLPSGLPNLNPKQFTPDPPKDKSGKAIEKYCGSCYGATPPESGCCNTCLEVNEAYQKMGWSFTKPKSMEQCIREKYVEQISDQVGEGCRFVGSVEINKVSGNFHIMAGETIKKNNAHAHVVHDYMPQVYDFTHKINSLSFGDTFENQKNPLDGVSKSTKIKKTQYQYFTKVVASEVRYLNGKVLTSNQYSVTEHEMSEAGDQDDHHSTIRPGLFCVFEISPMRIIYSESKRSLSSFISSVLAIVGSIFTVAGLLDSFIFRAERAITHKRQIGKLA